MKQNPDLASAHAGQLDTISRRTGSRNRLLSPRPCCRRLQLHEQADYHFLEWRYFSAGRIGAHSKRNPAMHTLYLQCRCKFMQSLPLSSQGPGMGPSAMCLGSATPAADCKLGKQTAVQYNSLKLVAPKSTVQPYTG